MKPEPKIFEFTSYKLEPKRSQIVFNYKIEFANKSPLIFTEKIVFPKAFSLVGVPRELLNNILSGLHIVLGISYYKLYCPPKIKTNIKLSKEQAQFWNTVYRKGLGEFFYRNKIDSENSISFPFNEKAKPIPYRLKRKNRALIGIGGGKDSIVAVELLKEKKMDIAALVIETQEKSPIISKVVQEMAIGSFIIKRYLDKKIFELHGGAYRGHIPISAIFAFLGYLGAVLYDYSHVVMANEYSSNFGNIKYLKETINHQWSKSSEFEELFQKYAKEFLCPDITYFSILRPFYEIRIVEIFSKYKKYFPIFTSCNQNFKIYRERPATLWCGECPKCVFIFILLSAFLSRKELLKIFNKNLYENKALLPLFSDILGYGKMKPFDCVGIFDEARAALFLARNNFKGSLIIKTFLPKIKKPDKLINKIFKYNDAPTLPENFKFFGAKNILILGYGKEGVASKKYLKKYFPKVKVGIADQKERLNYLEKQGLYDLAMKTPGIPKNLVKIPYTTATNIFFSQIKNMTIGITGSKGKSTTSSLIYAILKEAGKKVTILGNIGNPMLNILGRKIYDDEIFVIELSSYQLDDLHYSPNVAVVLNLFPEHMNYHGNIEKYFEAKKNIIKFQNPWDSFVYNSRNKFLKAWNKKSSAKSISFNDIKNIESYKSQLLGSHNLDNIKASIAVARILKISDKIIKKAIREFKPLPHRLEFVGEFRGIKFYDDAISTTPESTIAALGAIPNIRTIFLGGEDRGYDFSNLEKELRRKKVKNVVLFPETGKRILKSKAGFNILETSDMKEAVAFAYKNTSKGSTCLLSTASPSYSLWKNFEEKGDQFQYFVKKLAQRKRI